MKSVVIIGAGNVAFHIAKALIQNKITVQQIFSRTLENVRKVGEANNVAYTNKISELEKADLYIIATSDSAIEEVSSSIPFEDTLVVHTSGSMPMNTLKGNYRKGVLYPFQTFTTNRLMRYDNIPFLIEAENKADEKALFQLCQKISKEVHVINSEKRANVHLSGVWISNFVNHMYYVGEQICKENEIPFDVLKPLILEVANKVQDLEPYDAQTGPARRDDQIVIHKHLEMIDDSRLQLIYKLLSDSIQRTYHND